MRNAEGCLSLSLSLSLFSSGSGGNSWRAEVESRNRADIPRGRSWFDVHVRVSRSTVAETIARQIHAGASESLDSETSVN